KGIPLGQASAKRGDVAGAYPGYGAAHGFDVVVPLGSQVCAYGINQGPGANALLGCKVVPVDPFGRLDAVSRGADGMHAAGWAVDPDTGAPIDVHVYVDNHLAASGQASAGRDDVAATLPGFGPAHGFDMIVPEGSQVCAYGINQGLGTNALLGCGPIPLPPAAPPSAAPPPAAPPSAAPPSAATSPDGAGRMANDLLTRINDERAARGADPLAWDESLAAGARDWAEEMSRSGMRHSPASGQDYGENVQYLSAATSGALHVSWMSSGGHRDNIVWPAYGSVGVGIYCAPDGVVWAVERFARIDPAKQTSMGSSPDPIVDNDRGGPGC
ncbi:MAG: CAP domain-containing protein, partial [Actinobacteria bacterium]|nr:CAP domain-containing protein [Actinomycetota bacterium]